MSIYDRQASRKKKLCDEVTCLRERGYFSRDMECPSPPPRVFYDKIVTAVAQGSSHSTEPSPTACTSVATACGIHDAAASGPHPASGVRILHRMEEAVFDGRRDSALRDRANVSMSQGGSGGANIEKLRAVCALYDEMFPDILGPASATAASTQSGPGQNRRIATEIADSIIALESNDDVRRRATRQLRDDPSHDKAYKARLRAACAEYDALFGFGPGTVGCGRGTPGSSPQVVVLYDDDDDEDAVEGCGGLGISPLVPPAWTPVTLQQLQLEHPCTPTAGARLESMKPPKGHPQLLIGAAESDATWIHAPVIAVAHSGPSAAARPRRRREAPRTSAATAARAGFHAIVPGYIEATAQKGNEAAAVSTGFEVVIPVGSSFSVSTEDNNVVRIVTNTEVDLVEAYETVSISVTTAMDGDLRAWCKSWSARSGVKRRRQDVAATHKRGSSRKKPRTVFVRSSCT